MQINVSSHCLLEMIYSEKCFGKMINENRLVLARNRTFQGA